MADLVAQLRQVKRLSSSLTRTDIIKIRAIIQVNEKVNSAATVKFSSTRGTSTQASKKFFKHRKRRKTAIIQGDSHRCPIARTSLRQFSPWAATDNYRNPWSSSMNKAQSKAGEVTHRPKACSLNSTKWTLTAKFS